MSENVSAPSDDPKKLCTLGWLIAELESSEQTKPWIDEEYKREEARYGSIAADGWRVRAEAFGLFHRNPAAMAGLDRIILLCDELDNTDGLTAANVRKLRAKVCRARDCTLESANALSLTESANAIEGNLMNENSPAQMRPGSGSKSASVSDYYAEVRGYEDACYDAASGQRIIGLSCWEVEGNVTKLKQIDAQHGITPDDPRVYSIAAFRQERNAILKERENLRVSLTRKSDSEIPQALLRSEARLTDCFARHFPGLYHKDVRTVDTIPKLWAFIDKGVLGLNGVVRVLAGGFERKRRTYVIALRAVYGIMHELGIDWTPRPPYPDMSEQEAEHALRAIANRLEKAESESICEAHMPLRGETQLASRNLDLALLDPAERSVLAYLVERLRADQVVINPDEFRAHLTALGVYSRITEITRHLESLGVLEHRETPPPARPTAALTSENPETHRLLAYHQSRSEWWNITGHAIALHRKLQSEVPRESPKAGQRRRIDTKHSGLDRHLNELLDQLLRESPFVAPEFETLVPVLETLATFLWVSTQGGRFKSPDESDLQKKIVDHMRTMLGPEVTEHPAQAGGIVDIRYRGVITELKVEKLNGNREAICGKYSEQPTQYAASEARQVSVVFVLDLTAKDRPPGDIRNDIRLMSVPTHGGPDDSKKYPSKVIVLVLNGNLKSPSSYS
jgi:hypothetical protein